MTGGSMFYIDAVCNGLDNLPDGDSALRAELWERLGKEGAGTLAEELRLKDPLTYSQIDTRNSQRVIRALEVCLVSGRPFSLFKDGGEARAFLRDRKNRTYAAALRNYIHGLIRGF